MEHYRCRNCDRSLCHSDKTSCKICFQCPKCCNCKFCIKCNTKVRFYRDLDGCDKCSLCYNCGRCKCALLKVFENAKASRGQYLKRVSKAELILKDGNTINEARVAFHTSSRLEHKINSLSRHLSVEMEIAGLKPGYKEGLKDSPLAFSTRTMPINIAVEKWRGQIVKDMSLPAYGFEINTSPANGDRFIQQINEITTTLKNFNATCDNNYDPNKRIKCCGLHVHVDARDVGWEDLRRFLLLYEHLESAIYSMLPGYRRASHFSVPCGKRYGIIVRASIPSKNNAIKNLLKHNITRQVYGQTIPARGDKRACREDARYSSVNLHQVFYRGTIEFRHMFGTVDPIEITNWAMLVGQIVDYSVSCSMKQIKELISKAGHQEALSTIAYDHSPDLSKYVNEQIEKYVNDHNLEESPRFGNGGL